MKVKAQAKSSIEQKIVLKGALEERISFYKIYMNKRKGSEKEKDSFFCYIPFLPK